MLTSYLFDILPRMINYRLAYRGLARPMSPLNLTFSVTNMCQSRCLTCRIWEVYRQDSEKLKTELTIDEIERIFKSFGHVYFFNISGGEPFLRKDLPQIVDLALKYLTPSVIHTPTNALDPDRVERGTREILSIIEAGKRKVRFSIKPSLDGVGEVHDKIRGVPGNFEKLQETLSRLRGLKEKYPFFDIGVGTVISRYSIGHLKETIDFVPSLNVDSYINEIAENRTELFNVEEDITPTAEEYAKAMENFKIQTRQQIKKAGPLARQTLAFRLLYYDLVVKILRSGRQVIPCYGGISNVHINPYGEVWPCCILGYDKPMGDLREADYNFKRVWRSKKAKEVRRSIRNRECSCPLANQAYSNLLLHFPSLFKVLGIMAGLPVKS